MEAIELKKNQKSIERMLEITSNEDLIFNEKIKKLLDIGRQRLDLSIGFISKINLNKQTHKIEITGSNEKPQKNKKNDLSNTYCKKTIKLEDIHTIENAEKQGWKEDPAYELSNFSCYIGTKLEKNGSLYGSICFLDIENRKKEFTELEKSFMDILANMISHELSQKERKKQIIIMDRVLRHNIKNKIGIILNNIEYLEDRITENLDFKEILEKTKRNTRDIIDLGEKARLIDKVISNNRKPQKIDINVKINQTVKRISEKYPRAKIRTNLSHNKVYAIPEIDIAIKEIIENSIIHNPNQTPKIEISISEKQNDIDIVFSDNGSGIPKEEVEVIKKGDENSLSHSEGLGLWIVYWVVSKSQGHLEFKGENKKEIQITLQKVE